MAHSIASILVHIVFSTKNREPLITPEIETELYKYMAAIFRNHHSPSLGGNGTEDHVHFLISLARTISVADLVEEVKKSSSSWIKTKGPEFEAFQWQTGYGAFSIGASGKKPLLAYIAGQKEHHKKVSFQDEFRKLLRLYEIPLDEHNDWD